MNGCLTEQTKNEQTTNGCLTEQTKNEWMFNRTDKK